VYILYVTILQIIRILWLEIGYQYKWGLPTFFKILHIIVYNFVRVFLFYDDKIFFHIVMIM